MRAAGLAPSTRTCNTLVKGYARSGQLPVAFDVARRMHESRSSPPNQAAGGEETARRARAAAPTVQRAEGARTAPPAAPWSAVRV